jgi:adenosylcobinamide-GDP ribazoletransferase
VKDVLVATAFLTRVTVPVEATADAVGAAARWFPLVGGALGGAGALAAWAMSALLALPPLLTATLVVGLGAWVTGAIHLDGLADTADGFGGGRSREDVLRIMRDPTIGSYGATALVIVFVTKVSALAALLDRGAALPFLLVAPTMSRWTICALAVCLPYARSDKGVGLAVTRGRNQKGLLIATAITALIAITALQWDTLTPWVTATLTSAWVARVSWRRIGGVTGDVFGANVELTETVVLLCGVVLSGRS